MTWQVYDNVRKAPLNKNEKSGAAVRENATAGGTPIPPREIEFIT
jgi:hypothetical protein